MTNVTNTLTADDRGKVGNLLDTLTREQLALALKLWIEANGPGGWIDEMRKERDQLRGDLEVTRLQRDARRYT